MINSGKESFFSISTVLIPVQVPLTYSLYINVAGDPSREHFIRIFPDGGILEAHEIDEFKRKYHQLYVAETQRSAYMDAVVKSAGKTGIEKTAVLKDSAIHYLGNLFGGKREVTTEVLNQSIAGCRDVVENMVSVIQSYDVDQLQQMIANLSFHDFYTYDHSINVSMYCVVIYRALFPNATKNEIVQAGLGGMLHDLGKIKISTQIINKSGDLTDDERKEIQNHPDYGLEFLKTPGVKLPEGIDPVLVGRVVHEHHENYDGSGYPSKISDTKIHLLARITAVADFFDAITTKRSYHEALSIDDALALMQKTEGKKLDPKIFEIFAAHTRHHSHDPNYSTDMELPSNFDPCQPQQHLPFKIVGLQSKVKAPHVPPQKSEIKELLEERTRALKQLDKEIYLDPIRARRLTEAALELIFGLYSENHYVPYVHELLKVTAMITLKMIGPTPQLTQVLSKIQLDDPTTYSAAHSILLAELCCAIAYKVGWGSEPTSTKMIMAAFLHDIALGNHRISKFQKLKDVQKDGHFSKEEIEAFKNHPKYASEYARQLIGAPAELEAILVQHHERPDGTGFPAKLGQQQLTPLSCLFILGHGLLTYFLEKKQSARFEDWLKFCLKKYETGTFKKILKSL